MSFIHIYTALSTLIHNSTSFVLKIWLNCVKRCFLWNKSRVGFAGYLCDQWRESVTSFVSDELATPPHYKNRFLQKLYGFHIYLSGYT